MNCTLKYRRGLKVLSTSIVELKLTNSEIKSDNLRSLLSSTPHCKSIRVSQAVLSSYTENSLHGDKVGNACTTLEMNIGVTSNGQLLGHHRGF